MSRTKRLRKTDLKAAAAGTGRSPLFRYMVEDHARLAATADGAGRMNWAVLCPRFEALVGNLFFQLVNARYERGAMILTSNRGFAEWGEVFGDPVVATALLDRLLHHATVVQIEGNSYRMRRHADLVPDTMRTRSAPPPPLAPAKRRGRPPKDRSADQVSG